MMKRFQFLAAIFGFGAVVKGQKTGSLIRTPPGITGEGDCMGMDGWVECPSQFLSKNPKLLKNNQCPVCGTMTKPYHRLTEYATYGSDVCFMDGSLTLTNSVCRRPSDTKLTGPMEQLVRCKTCNAAFYQDAEGEPTK